MLMIRSVVRSKNSRNRSSASSADAARRSICSICRRRRTSATARAARFPRLSLCSRVIARGARSRMLSVPRKKPSSSMSGMAARKRRNGEPPTIGWEAKRGSARMSEMTDGTRSCCRRAVNEYATGSETTSQPTEALIHSRSASRNPRKATGAPVRRAASATSWSKSGSRVPLLTRAAERRCKRAASAGAASGRKRCSVITGAPIGLPNDTADSAAWLAFCGTPEPMRYRWFALAAVPLAFACRKAPEPPAVSTDTATTATMVVNETTGTQTGTGATGGGSSTLSNAERTFLIAAAQAGLAEISFGTLAEKQAASPEVRTFGSRMVADHTRAQTELKLLATNKGLALPAAMTDEQRKSGAALAKKSGKDFDKAYLAEMVADHEKVVADFRKAMQETKDPEVQAWVSKTLPTLQEHLDMARAATLGGS